MLRIIQNTSAAGAKSYYTSPSMADYYTEGQELIGIWRGEGAARLNLSGSISKADWESLCDNRNPGTGETLTARHKSERRVGYDFNFHLPKSVSLLQAATGDERIVGAFRGAVHETMTEMEAEMKARVRRHGRNEDRITGNMIWGEFIHFTSRPVDGKPDPHLHCHAFVHNVTFDPQEQRWKAGQFADLKRDAPYFEAVFHSKMATRMEKLGLPVERTKKGWEIAGLEKGLLDKFSRRNALIAKVAEKEGLNTGAGRADLGAKTRERKNKNLSMGELRQEWMSRLTPDERSALANVEKRIGTLAIPERESVAREAASLAVEHCFERKSVVPERMVITEALKRSVGQVSRQRVEQAVAGQNLLLGERDGRRVATTAAVLAEEKGMIDFARDGRGTCAPFAKDAHAFKREWLNKEQRRAVEHILQSQDRVIVVRGAAGTGKTSMMREAAEGIEAGGTKVFTFAPSADASRGVLRTEGFKDADTVARLLKDERLQQSVARQALWIDESGLLGTRTMAQVFKLADRLDARVILSGDTRQHGAVERGAALRLLEEGAGIVPAEIRDIQRQKGSYKQVVKALSEGRTGEALRQLDQLGWVKEVDRAERYKVRDLLRWLSAGMWHHKPQIAVRIGLWLLRHIDKKHQPEDCRGNRDDMHDTLRERFLDLLAAAPHDAREDHPVMKLADGLWASIEPSASNKMAPSEALERIGTLPGRLSDPYRRALLEALSLCTDPVKHKNSICGIARALASGWPGEGDVRNCLLKILSLCTDTAKHGEAISSVADGKESQHEAWIRRHG
jgi:conjugative relaxase-like TrwC/TraI family protein